MQKPARNDIAAFPELFADMDQFIEELGNSIRRASLRFAVAAIPGGGLVLFILSRVG